MANAKIRVMVQGTLQNLYPETTMQNVSGLTEALNGKANSSHTHNYAGSSSAGGIATSAAKLSNTSKIGDTNKPVYFKADGTPAAINYTIDKSVPSNAVFTDTTYSAATQSANGLMSSTDKTKLDGVATGANNYTHPTTSGNKHIPSGGSSGQILRWSADGTAAWGSDNNTWTAMVGATSSANGSVGYVNAVPPKDGYNTKYLRADGSWQVPPNTTYSAATQSANGLMSSTDKTKLDGIATGATANIGTVTTVKVGSTSYSPSSGVISLPAYPSDTNTHRPIQMNGTEILGDNTTALNLKAGSNVSLSNSSGTVTIAATDTTYSAATQSANGLMSSTDKTKLDKIYSNNNYRVTANHSCKDYYTRTSLSVQADPNRTLRITARCMFVNNICKGIVLSKSTGASNFDNVANAYAKINTSEEFRALELSCILPPGSDTIYLWVKYDGEGTNQVQLYVEHLM